MHAALQQRGGSAVITGASPGGIGFAIAQILLKRYKKRVILADVTGLDSVRDVLVKQGIAEEDFLLHQCDVTQFDQVQQLATKAFEWGQRVDFLVLNSGVGVPTKDFGGEIQDWHKTLNVNLFGVLNGTQAFVDSMVKQGSPAAVVITGSKQGITQPPGNPAYNVSKSAVKSLAESLSHSLLDTSVTAHLLVPGYTYTKLTSRGKSADDAAGESKPAAAWSSDQVAEELFSRLDEFYIICPDNDVDWQLDSARMEWTMQDILQKRPALSRWHPEFKDAFAKFVKEKTGKM